jgi:hypothetical protein
VKPFVLRLLPLVGAAVLLMQLFWWLPAKVHWKVHDAEVYRLAAVRAVASEPVYIQSPRQFGRPPNDFFYPPTALAFLVPFAHAAPVAFYTGYYLLLIVSLWAFAAALARIAFDRLVLAQALAVGAVVTTLPPVMLVMQLGNADIIVLALTAWAFARPAAAAPLLVVAGAVKVYPLFVLIAWWPRLTPRQRAHGLATAAVLTTVTLLALGHGTIDQFYAWLTTGLSMLATPATAWGNISLSTLVLRPFLDSAADAQPNDLLRSLPLLAACGFVGPAWAKPQVNRASGAIVLVAAVLFAPVCWWWRLLMTLMIPAALVARHRRARGDECQSTSG